MCLVTVHLGGTIENENVISYVSQDPAYLERVWKECFSTKFFGRSSAYVFYVPYDVRFHHNITLAANILKHANDWNFSVFS